MLKKEETFSEGEETIKEFFEEEGIRYEFQRKIKLKDDRFENRIADFYLPQYKVYIEFLGQWNNQQDKERYKEKMRAYERNNVPCAYIFPDNLGILKTIFKRRLKKTLQKYPKLKWQLFKLNWNIFTQKIGLQLIILGFLIYYINGWSAKTILSVILVYCLYSGLKESFFKIIKK